MLRRQQAARIGIIVGLIGGVTVAGLGVFEILMLLVVFSLMIGLPVAIIVAVVLAVQKKRQ